MNRRRLFLGLATATALTACSARGGRLTPKLGRVEDVRTQKGEYDGYSVERHFDFAAPMQGSYGHLALTGTGPRPIVVQKRTRRADGMPLSGAPGLRIDPIMMRSEDPRGEDFFVGRIEGLDYEYLRQKGWLFPCDASTQWLCKVEAPQLVTPSFEFVDPLVDYLGRWLKAGGFGGSLTIAVWQPRGTPADVRTSMGRKDGFTVEWARGPDYPERSAIALTGHGTQLFPPAVEGQPAEYAKRGNTAVVLEGPGRALVNLLSRSTSYPPYIVDVHLSSYASVDEAIAEYGHALREGQLQGTIVITVGGPFLFISN
ncbi:hypothetical protein LZ198_28435 [Myxococcus sp. K15C18031901]|uniref:hypothetical protein n=1 Tax=Myxococcus dinghuensis TaxID=2906761 RepID=UPI0020A7B9FE|nr:hypothetical protein [Myxococcus dinghuensis]MCP3102811.1 hypothetical protein [Myxococcus dinghuensis]